MLTAIQLYMLISIVLFCLIELEKINVQKQDNDIGLRHKMFISVTWPIWVFLIRVSIEDQGDYWRIEWHLRL